MSVVGLTSGTYKSVKAHKHRGLCTYMGSYRVVRGGGVYIWGEEGHTVILPYEVYGGGVYAGKGAVWERYWGGQELKYITLRQS